MTPEQRRTLTDLEVITLYELWGETPNAASFSDPAPAVVAAFRAWLLVTPHAGRLVYEQELLAEFRRQEEA